MMIIRPNKTLGKPAVYERTKIQFNPETKKITFQNPNKAIENGTLK